MKTTTTIHAARVAHQPASPRNPGSLERITDDASLSKQTGGPHPRAIVTGSRLKGKHDHQPSQHRPRLVTFESCHILSIIVFSCLLCSSMSIQFGQHSKRHVANRLFITPTQQSPWSQSSRSATLPATNKSERSDRLVKLQSVHDANQSDVDHKANASLSRLAMIQSQLMSLRRQLEAELTSFGELRGSSEIIGIGSPCLKSSDCSQKVSNSHCKSENFTCSCLPLYVEYNSTTCLAPSLLGYECIIDAQCEQKVANSKCSRDGKCTCAEHFVAYRRDKCLAGSNINDYCLNDGQCQLNDKHSYCKWKIPHVYGQCKCPPNYKLIARGATNNQSNGTMCVPRLGDTCLSDDECLLATSNSRCKEPHLAGSQSESADKGPLDHLEMHSRPRAGHRISPSMNLYPLAWPTSGASSRRCQCSPGFREAPNRLDCLPVDITSSHEDAKFAQHHHYELIGSAGEAPKQNPVDSQDPHRPGQKVNVSPAASSATLERDQGAAGDRIDIKLLPGTRPAMQAGGSTGPAASSTTPTTTTSTTTTSRPPAVNATTKEHPWPAPNTEQQSETTTNQRQSDKVPSNNKDKLKLSSLGKACSSSRECQARDPNSDCIDGICECLRPTSRCRASSNGCHKQTFQCRNGQCISWYFVCDQYRNCDDGSDEDECKAYSCPAEAFQCHSDGQCLNLAKLCNGIRDCSDGSDEMECNGTKWTGALAAASGYNSTLGSAGPQNDSKDAASSQFNVKQMESTNATNRGCHARAFTCSDGQCLPSYVFCNAVVDCADGSDELEALCDRQTLASDNWRRRKPPMAASLAKRRPLQPKHSQSSLGFTSSPVSSLSYDTGNSLHRRWQTATSKAAGESPVIKMDRAAIEQLLAGLVPHPRGTAAPRPNYLASTAAAAAGHQRRLEGNEGAPGGARRRSRLLGAAHECPRDSFTCGTGKCRSSAILCSGVDGCGDNSDEDRCEVCQCEPV